MTLTAHVKGRAASALCMYRAVTLQSQQEMK